MRKAIRILPPVQRSCRLALLLFTGTVLVGCARIERPTSSPLAKPQMFSDSVALQLTFVRFPQDSPELNDQLWADVDETKIPIERRRQLAAQGFRAGVLGGYLPPALASRLEPAEAGISPEMNLEQLDPDCGVTTRHVQARHGHSVDVLVSGPLARLPLLEFSPDGSLRGRDFTDAECHFALEARPQTDGAVLLDLLPEIHHGQPRQRLSPQPEMGMVFFQSARDRKALDALRIETVLAAGEMLLVTGRPELPGTLGHHFFMSAEGEPRQKLLLVRVAQTQALGAFTEADLLSNSPDGARAAEDVDVAAEASADATAPGVESARATMPDAANGPRGE